MEEKKNPSKQIRNPGPPKKDKELPEDFYRKLLRQPSCKTLGICDGCGNCEH